MDRTSRTRYADSTSPFPHLRSLSPYNTRIKVEAGTEVHNALVVSIEEYKGRDQGQPENHTSDRTGEAKCEEPKVQSLEADEAKMADLRLTSVDLSERKPANTVEGYTLTTIRADSERRNSEVYQEFLESYDTVTRTAAALCSNWSPDSWFLKQETLSMEPYQQLEAFCAEFLDYIKAMQSSLDRICQGDRAYSAPIQAIRRFLRHLLRMSSNVLQKFHNGLETTEDSHLKAQIALVGDLVHLLGDVIARMIMAAKKDMAFPHRVDTDLRIQTAIAVPSRLQGLGLPQNLILPQFITGSLIIASADFL